MNYFDKQDDSWNKGIVESEVDDEDVVTSVLSDDTGNDEVENVVITERVKTKLAYDIKRRKRQDEQGVWMQTQYNNTVKVNLEDIVTYSVDPRDRCANINRGLIGVVLLLVVVNIIAKIG